MKPLICIGLLLMSSLGMAQDKIAEAKKGTEYGAGVSESITYNVYDTGKLIKTLRQKKELSDIVIKAKAIEVCPKKGCWISLENPEGITIFVKMKDYAFFLPKSIVGKTILLHGKATLNTTPVKELQHYALDAGKSKEEIARITQPKTEVRVLATGIKVID